MKEISNSTLALLVVAAIVVSISGSLISLNKLGEIGGITGMLSTSATQTGKANLTVPATAYINLTDDIIDLGIIDIALTNTSDEVNDWWIVRNDGSVNISIRIFGDQDHDSDDVDDFGRGPFVSDTTGSGCLANVGVGSPNACFMTKCMNSTSNTAPCNNSYYALENSSDTARYILVDLLSVDGNDTAWFGANATVPEGEPSGVKTQTVTFLAAQS